jgi:hypothetical protein
LNKGLRRSKTAAVSSQLCRRRAVARVNIKSYAIGRDPIKCRNPQERSNLPITLNWSRAANDRLLMNEAQTKSKRFARADASFFSSSL